MDMETTIGIGLAVGAICGLVPLVYGLVRGRTGLAIGGFVACLVGGVALGLLLAVPLAGLFAYLVHRSVVATDGAPRAMT